MFYSLPYILKLTKPSALSPFVIPEPAQPRERMKNGVALEQPTLVGSKAR